MTTEKTEKNISWWWLKLRESKQLKLDRVVIMASAEGYKSHITKNLNRILGKISNLDDKWGQDFLIHINNAKKHSKLCMYKKGKVYAPVHIKRAYMNEIWLSELPPPPGVDTQELLTFVIDDDGTKFKNTLNRMAPSMKTEDLDMWYVTMTNLYAAVDKLFGSEYDEKPLTEELVQLIHRTVTVNVLETAGEYRMVEVGAAGSSVKYESPDKIQPRLSALIEVINANILKATDFQSAAAVGGFFLSEFLLIHPFRDGNGRVSRLLLSHLLRHWTVVPVSLYLRSNRGFYIKAMQSRTTATALPLDVINYVAQCIEETILLHYHDQLDSLPDGSVPAEVSEIDVADKIETVALAGAWSLILYVGLCAVGMLGLSHLAGRAELS